MKEKHKLRDKFLSLETKLKRVSLRLHGEATIVINNITGENISFLNLRKVADFIGIHRSYLSKSIKEQKFYLGRGYLVYKSFTSLDDITNSEAYKEAIYKLDNEGKKYTHSESAKESIRTANLGKKLSEEMKSKLLAGKKAKSKVVLLTNNETKEIFEFTSVLAASKSLGISNSHLDRCLKSNKHCKGYTVGFK